MYSAAQESSTTQEPSAAQESSRLYTHARCSLLGKYYPYSLVCGAHLFKYGWREKVYDASKTSTTRVSLSWITLHSCCHVWLLLGM